MPESHSIEDEAARYVLGQLGSAERHAFEARLEQSAELRALVREFEASTVALALAAPQRQPPPRVWQRIEETVAKETNRKVVAPVVWRAWLRNGWIAAAACLLGWLLYALWGNRAGLLPFTALPIASEHHSPAATPSASFAHSETATASTQPGLSSNTVSTSPQLSLQTRGQIAGLRRQVADLESQMAQLSQLLTQQQALLIESSRPRFFHLIPANSVGQAGQAVASPSPALQRALLLALARELGWLRPPAHSKNEAESQSKDTDSVRADNLRVDFVDLPPVGRDAANQALIRAVANELVMAPNLQAQTVTTPGVPSDATTTAESASAVPAIGAIPGFVSGTNVVLAFDTSVVPSGMSFTLFSETDNFALQPQGTLTLGTNPLVVTMPLTAAPNGGLNLAVTAGNVSFGPTNLVVRPPLLRTNVP